MNFISFRPWAQELTKRAQQELPQQVLDRTEMKSYKGVLVAEDQFGGSTLGFQRLDRDFTCLRQAAVAPVMAGSRCKHAPHGPCGSFGEFLCGGRSAAGGR